MSRVPVVTVTAPVNVFAPDNASVPAALNVSPTLPLRTPESVNVVAALGVIAPPPSVTFRAEVNVPLVSRAPPLSVTAPDVLPRFASALTCSVPAMIVVPPVYVFVPVSTTRPALLMISAPLPLTTPESVRRPSAVGPKVPPPSVTARAEVKFPVGTSVPPLRISVFAALPRSLSAPNFSEPTVTVTLPVNVFVPESTSVPAPFSVNPPAPFSTPDSVSVVALFGLNAPPPSVMFRADANVAVVMSVPPFSVTVSTVLPRFASALICRFPAVIVVPPVYVFVPERTSVPAFSVSAPAPLMIPDSVNVPLPLLPTSSAAALLILPVNVPDCPALALRSPPVPPVVRLPFHVNPVVSSRFPNALPPPACEPPIVRVRPAPEPPRLAALLTSTWPASIVVWVWVLVPPSVRVPLLGLVVLMTRFVSVIAVLYVKLPVGTSQSVVPMPLEMQLCASAGTTSPAPASDTTSVTTTAEDHSGLQVSPSARRSLRHVDMQRFTRVHETARAACDSHRGTRAQPGHVAYRDHWSL